MKSKKSIFIYILSLLSFSYIFVLGFYTLIQSIVLISVDKSSFIEQKINFYIQNGISEETAINWSESNYIHYVNELKLFLLISLLLIISSLLIFLFINFSFFKQHKVENLKTRNKIFFSIFLFCFNAYLCIYPIVNIFKSFNMIGLLKDELLNNAISETVYNERISALITPLILQTLILVSSAVLLVVLILSIKSIFHLKDREHSTTRTIREG